MIYQVNLSLPSNTTQSDPVVVSLSLPHGVVRRVALLFPAGCAGLAHVQIYHNEFQLWPTTPQMAFLGDGTYITFEENYALDEPWNQLNIVGWNDDDTYRHVITVWLLLLPPERPWSMIGYLGIPG